MSNHQDYQSESGSGQQVVMSHLEASQMHESEQDQMQIEKYFKYSHPTNMAHSSLTPQNILDSNHNYASDLRYYTPQQSQMDLANSQCIVSEPNKDGQISSVGISHGMDHYHQNLDMSKYQDQTQQMPQVQNLDHASKTDDDFSVILADVRKTCYSS